MSSATAPVAPSTYRRPGDVLVPSLFAVALAYPLYATVWHLPQPGGSWLPSVVVLALLAILRVQDVVFSQLRAPLILIAGWLVGIVFHAALWPNLGDIDEASILYPAAALVALIAGATMRSLELVRSVTILTTMNAILVVYLLDGRIWFDYANKAILNAKGISLNSLSMLGLLAVAVCIASLGRSNRPRRVPLLSTLVGGAAGGVVLFTSGSLSILPIACLVVLAVLAGRIDSGIVRRSGYLLVAVTFCTFARFLWLGAQSDDAGFRGRSSLWRTAAFAIPERLPSGIGVDQSYIVVWGFHPTSGVLAGGAHNWYLQMALALGMIGITLVVGVLIVASYTIWVINRRRTERLVVGLGAWVTVGVFSRGMIESDGSWIFLKPSIQSILVWVTVGYLFSFRQRSTADVPA